jgi:hypothetical protein
MPQATHSAHPKPWASWCDIGHTEIIAQGK